MPRSSREKIYARANVASYLDVSAASISVADPKRTKFYLARILMPTRAHASASKLEGFNQREANHRKKDGWMSWKTIRSAVVGVRIDKHLLNCQWSWWLKNNVTLSRVTRSRSRTEACSPTL